MKHLRLFVLSVFICAFAPPSAAFIWSPDLACIDTSRYDDDSDFSGGVYDARIYRKFLNSAGRQYKKYSSAVDDGSIEQILNYANISIFRSAVMISYLSGGSFSEYTEHDLSDFWRSYINNQRDPKLDLRTEVSVRLSFAQALLVFGVMNNDNGQVQTAVDELVAIAKLADSVLVDHYGRVIVWNRVLARLNAVNGLAWLADRGASSPDAARNLLISTEKSLRSSVHYKYYPDGVETPTSTLQTIAEGNRRLSSNSDYLLSVMNLNIDAHKYPLMAIKIIKEKIAEFGANGATSHCYTAYQYWGHIAIANYYSRHGKGAADHRRMMEAMAAARDLTTTEGQPALRARLDRYIADGRYPPSHSFF